MSLSPESRVGEIAARHPLATRVFARHGIDFCCGGGVALADACAKREIDPAGVLQEIEREITSPGADLATRNWQEAPLGDLVVHIVERYHDPLREELPRLEAMARRVFRVHGDKDPERLGALLESFLRLKSELDEHLHEEEESLFPSLLLAAAGQPSQVASFVDDHTRVGQELHRIRELTDDFRVPAEACNTWNALWHGLAALETDLHEHIHLENNVLFPRAAAA
ncbi:MAG: iron-sulfur cluster repair di-iron protein [Thermoanaerobaculia bacterium]|nr:MAG: iron-sulfur cluster repair di-iron protein [Thermoanaerobaculia bacterium]MBZ0100862.1 iron-sulfur cluster repair di-iron protein [Thermoanaerobaculia bacterium]